MLYKYFACFLSITPTLGSQHKSFRIIHIDHSISKYPGSQNIPTWYSVPLFYNKTLTTPPTLTCIPTLYPMGSPHYKTFIKYLSITEYQNIMTSVIAFPLGTGYLCFMSKHLSHHSCMLVLKGNNKIPGV